MNQKYQRVLITVFKYYLKAIAGYSAEKFFLKKNNSIKLLPLTQQQLPFAKSKFFLVIAVVACTRIEKKKYG